MKRTILHYVAKVLALLIHVDGRPLGSSRNVDPVVGGGPCEAKARDH
jgi:hypothetical protein